MYNIDVMKKISHKISIIDCLLRVKRPPKKPIDALDKQGIIKNLISGFDNNTQKSGFSMTA